jgi:hypothetical protein
MITQNQFPLGKPTTITNRGSSYTGLTILIVFSAIMIGGAYYYLHNTNTQNEKNRN